MMNPKKKLRSPRQEASFDTTFFGRLAADDEIGVVIRAHIDIESRLITFIEEAVMLPNELPRLTYESRL